VKNLDQVECVDFIARPTDLTGSSSPGEFVALIAITYKDGSREEIYRSPDYHDTIHAAIWDAAKTWRTVYLKK
jgi:hypothetical protein